MFGLRNDKFVRLLIERKIEVRRERPRKKMKVKVGCCKEVKELDFDRELWGKLHGQERDS